MEARRPVDDGRIRFTRSNEGRRFSNGVILRPGIPVAERRYYTYFPSHYYYYPHYVIARPSYEYVYSPWHFYFDIMPPCIERQVVYVSRPSVVYIESPAYVDDVYVVDNGGGYYLNQRGDDSWRDVPQLNSAVYDLADAFRNGDITLLTDHADPSVQIAIFEKGQYQYSLSANDYLDMTRDFLQNARTVSFDVYKVRNRTSNVYQMFVRHVYSDAEGQAHTIYVCMVLERVGGQWVLTQVDTSPDRINN